MSRKVYSVEQLLNIVHALEPTPPPSEELARFKEIGIDRLHLDHRADVRYKVALPDDELLLIRKSVNGTLNKLTAEKYDSLLPYLQDDNVFNTMSGEVVLGLVIAKAKTESYFSEMYAKCCRALSDVAVEQGWAKRFHLAVENTCGVELEKALSTAQAAETTAEAGDPRLRICSNISECISQLYIHEMLDQTFMCSHLSSLLYVDQDGKPLETEEFPSMFHIQAACKILELCGANWHENSKESLELYMERIKKLSATHPKPRVKFMLLDLVELQGRGWEKRIKEAKPQKLDEGNNIRQTPLTPPRSTTPEPGYGHPPYCRPVLTPTAHAESLAARLEGVTPPSSPGPSYMSEVNAQLAGGAASFESANFSDKSALTFADKIAVWKQQETARNARKSSMTPPPTGDRKWGHDSAGNKFDRQPQAGCRRTTTPPPRMIPLGMDREPTSAPTVFGAFARPQQHPQSSTPATGGPPPQPFTYYPQPQPQTQTQAQPQPQVAHSLRSSHPTTATPLVSKPLASPPAATVAQPHGATYAQPLLQQPAYPQQQQQQPAAQESAPQQQTARPDTPPKPSGSQHYVAPGRRNTPPKMSILPVSMAAFGAADPYVREPSLSSPATAPPRQQASPVPYSVSSNSTDSTESSPATSPKGTMHGSEGGGVPPPNNNNPTGGETMQPKTATPATPPQQTCAVIKTKGKGTRKWQIKDLPPGTIESLVSGVDHSASVANINHTHTTIHQEAAPSAPQIATTLQPQTAKPQTPPPQHGHHNNADPPISPQSAPAGMGAPVMFRTPLAHPAVPSHADKPFWQRASTPPPRVAVPAFAACAQQSQTQASASGSSSTMSQSTHEKRGSTTPPPRTPPPMGLTTTQPEKHAGTQPMVATVKKNNTKPTKWIVKT